MGDSPIGNVSTYYIQVKNSLSEDLQINVSKGFTVNSLATYSDADRASRALIQATANTYQDTILVTNISVNEVLSV